VDKLPPEDDSDEQNKSSELPQDDPSEEWGEWGDSGMTLEQALQPLMDWLDKQPTPDEEEIRRENAERAEWAKEIVENLPEYVGDTRDINNLNDPKFTSRLMDHIVKQVFTPDDLYACNTCGNPYEIEVVNRSYNAYAQADSVTTQYTCPQCKSVLRLSRLMIPPVDGADQTDE